MTAHLDLQDHFKTSVARDVAAMVLGDCQGYGTHRVIFEHASNPDLIVKVEPHSGSFSNIREYDVWQAVLHTEFARWFAPVVELSPCGIVLTMRRCEPVPRHLLPAKVPAFFTDLKAENWGLFEGQVVCLDYGNHLMLERGMTRRMREVNW